MITIQRIHIKNFRSIVDETIDLKDFNCFVGKNDSGKSNVLKALNLFFNGKTEYNLPFNFNTDYSKLAKRGQKQAKEISIEIEIQVPESFKESGIKKWKKVWRSEGLHSNNISSLFSAGSKGVTYLNRIKYLYIPAVKSNDFFKELLSVMYDSMSQATDSALRDLNNTYSHELQTLTKDLTLQLNSILKINSAIQMPTNLKQLFRDLTFMTSDDSVKGIDLVQRGDGIKARHIPSILRFIQKNTEDGRKKQSIAGSYIWGFEEPENGVEYLSCFEMAQEFLSYINNCQILLTSHSPAFFTQCSGENCACFLTERKDGCSKYSVNEDNRINSEMGLMQIVAPFIEAMKNEFIKPSQEKNNTYNDIVKRLLEALSIMRRAETQLQTGQIITVIEQYAIALDLLDDYDHQRLEKPSGTQSVYKLEYSECREIINSMRFAAESDLFGNEKDDSFKGSIANIYQSFGGVDVYPSVEEKAANLLYFITKNHSFSDGNKRIAAAIFLYFLDKNNILLYEGEKVIPDSTLVAIIVMIAESDPSEKETMIKLIMNFLKNN